MSDKDNTSPDASFDAWVGVRSLMLDTAREGRGGIVKKIYNVLHRLQWRVRFAWHGYRRTGFASISMWWAWSDTDYDAFADMSTPYEAMCEECYAMAASQ